MSGVETKPPTDGGGGGGGVGVGILHPPIPKRKYIILPPQRCPKRYGDMEIPQEKIKVLNYYLPKEREKIKNTELLLLKENTSTKVLKRNSEQKRRERER
jgi:hypothetical protein